MLNHQAVASLSCDDCEEYMISDIESATFMEVRGERVKRNGPTPCHKCPKCVGIDYKNRTPAEGRKATLNRANLNILRAYLANQATHGKALSKEELRSPIVLRRFGLIEWTLRDHGTRAINSLLRVIAARG